MTEERIRRVAVTGASGQVGRGLLAALDAAGIRAVALTRRPAELPAERVVVDALDGHEASEVLAEAEAVVHLAGALRPGAGESYESANVATARAVADAVRSGAARRIVFLSYVGARVESPNRYLSSKGAAERILQNSGKALVAFRCTHILGTPDDPGPTATALTARPGRAALVLGTGRQAWDPICREDVVAALVSALRGGPPGIYDLAGPDRFSVDELVRLLSRDPAVRIRHLPAWLARGLGLVVPSLPGPLVDLLLRDSLGDSSRAIGAFGLQLTSPRAVWAPDPNPLPPGSPTAPARP